MALLGDKLQNQFLVTLMSGMLAGALYVLKKCLLHLFLYGRTLTKWVSVRQFIMEQSG
jgi:hypothetical protein